MLVLIHVVHCDLVVSVLDCQSRGHGFKSQPGQMVVFGYRLNLCLHRQLSYDEYTGRTLSVGRWDNEVEDWIDTRCHMPRLRK